MGVENDFVGKLGYEFVKSNTEGELHMVTTLTVTDAETPAAANGLYHIRAPYQSGGYLPESLHNYSKGMENRPWFENDTGYCIAWQSETDDSQNGIWICVNKHDLPDGWKGPYTSKKTGNKYYVSPSGDSQWEHPGKIIKRYSTKTLGLGDLDTPEYARWPGPSPNVTRVS